MTRDFGRIETINGRWVWPFAVMQSGDFFFVAHDDRDPEKLRKLVAVRAAQLGKQFSVEKHWREGMTRVQCTGPERELTLADIMG